MIATAENGRISGVFIVRRLLSQKLIYAGEQDIVWKSHCHTLRGLQFSPDLKSDLEIMEDFRKIAKNVLYLYYFAEGQQYLRVPAAEISSPYREALHSEDITGITLLRMITDGAVRIFFDDEETVLYADPEFLSAVPEGAELLRNLIRTICLFAGETAPKRILIQEKTDIDTRELSSGLSISYGADSWDSEAPGADLAYLYMADEELPLDEAEMTKEQESTLIMLGRMMQDLDDESDRPKKDSSRFALSFDQGKRLECMDYSIAVPDSFLVSADNSGAVSRMWLPNPENPEEWEASLFSLRIDRKTADSADETPPREVLEGQVLRINRVFRAENDRLYVQCRMIGVTEENLSSAENAVEMLFRTVLVNGRNEEVD